MITELVTFELKSRKVKVSDEKIKNMQETGKVKENRVTVMKGTQS